MRAVCISDTHCQLSQIRIPEADIVIHAGDALSRGNYSEWLDFIEEFSSLPHKYKIYVPGNHDWITEKNEALCKEECEKAGIIYLNNSGIEIEGKKFWGSAITPRFYNWAWNKDSQTDYSLKPNHPQYDSIKPYWDMIPAGTDVLITHGPPYGILDISIYSHTHCGCPILLDKVLEIQPKCHIFGHIHAYHGVAAQGKTTFINASSCTEKYDPTNVPHIIYL